MKAIILAAGMGSRLKPLTNSLPKAMVELQGIPMLKRQAHTLRELGITDITVIGGYRSDMLDVDGESLIINPMFAQTNMVYTLFCADSIMDGHHDLIISYGDIIYEPRVLNALIAAEDEVAVIVDKNWEPYWKLRMEDPLKDAETLRLDQNQYVLELGKKPRSYREIEGQYIGLIKVSASFVAEFLKHWKDLDRDRMFDGQTYQNMYMTSFLQHLINSGVDVKGVLVKNGWLEVDTLEDLALYERMYDDGQLNQYIKL